MKGETMGNNYPTFEAVKVALKQDRTGYILTLSIHPDEIDENLLRDFVGSRYGVAMVRIQDNETPVVYNNYRIKKAGILCREISFIRWLESLNFDVKTEEQAVDVLHKLCSINSRTEFNTNVNAQQLFDEMVKEYDEWKEESEPF
jgi:hypothetical protein